MKMESLAARRDEIEVRENQLKQSLLKFDTFIKVSTGTLPSQFDIFIKVNAKHPFSSLTLSSRSLLKQSLLKFDTFMKVGTETVHSQVSVTLS